MGTVPPLTALPKNPPRWCSHRLPHSVNGLGRGSGFGSVVSDGEEKETVSRKWQWWRRRGGGGGVKKENG